MSKELKDKTVISVNPASVSQPTEEKLKEKEASSVPSTTKTKTTKNESTQSRSDEKKEKVKEGEEEDDEKHMRDVRIAVAGNVDSGKSTLIGVLTGGVLDDGRGLARSKVFVHAHESANGRTSCISQHIMGFNTEGKPVHQPVAASATPAQKTKSWKEVVTNSHSLRTFIDLAGHERYRNSHV